MATLAGTAPAAAQRGTVSTVAAVRLVATRAGTVGLRPDTASGSLAFGPAPGARLPVVTTWDVDPGQLGRVQLRSEPTALGTTGTRYILRSPGPLPRAATAASHDIGPANPIAEGLDHVTVPAGAADRPFTLRLVLY